MRMEILLGIAALAGLALLVQSKPLPSEADVVKALDKLDKNPDDPDANTVAGKYKAFVMGDYKEGMTYLSKSNDKTLKSLADHEQDIANTVTPVQKVTMGDEWVTAAKKFPALSRIFYDRASQWYSLAWPDLDLRSKEKLRIQGLKLAASRPPGGARKGLPQGWVGDGILAGMGTPVTDGAVAHTGSYSIKIVPSDEKVKNTFTQLKSDVLEIPPGKELEYAAWVLSNGTESSNDRLMLYFIEKNNGSVFIPTDLPFWTRVSGKLNIPDGATRVMLGAIQSSKKGNVWIDDVSIKVDGKEIIKNPSFE